VSKRKFIAMQRLIEQASGRLKSYRTTSLTPAWKQGERLFAPALEAEGDEAVRNYHLDFERGEGQLVLGLRLRDGIIEITRYEFWIPRLFEPAYRNRFDEIQAMTD
jgi:hypothetical protein